MLKFSKTKNQKIVKEIKDLKEYFENILILDQN